GLLGVALVLFFVPQVPAEGARPFDLKGFLLTGSALALTLAGLELSSAPTGGAGTLAVLALGLVAGWAAVRHLRCAPHALLDMAVLKVPTFAFATLSAGTAGRLAVNATPFLLPLLFQVGLGMDAVETGSLVLVYFLGNLLMKSVTTPALRLFGFRTLLVVNGLVAALTIGAFAFVDGNTPWLLLFGLLIVCGLSRSMQFTALTTIAFADVTPAQRSAATTISAMLQQLAQLLGVAVAAAVIRLSAALFPEAAGGGMLVDIRAAFLCIAAIGLVSALRFLALPAGAGAEVSGHRHRPS
ncbi:MAG: MFS transporter, partial [Proteobacteria bacterium]|nr:MFS transporter [Pseudomonadota bacterium]